MAKRLQRSTSRPTAAAPASPSAGTAEAPRKRGGRVSGTAVTEFTIQLATLTEAGIPRAHYAILKDGQKVGEVTSGTMGPSVKKAVGIGYVPPALAAEGSTFHVDIRNRPVAARVVKTPFYKK